MQSYSDVIGATDLDQSSPIVETNRDFKLSKDQWRGVLAEFLGTAFFIWTCTIAATFSSVFGGGFLYPLLASMLSLAVLLHSFAPVSGGHFNPALTLAIMATRHIPVLQGLLYIIAQFGGSILGTALTLLMTPRDLAPYFVGDLRIVPVAFTLGMKNIYLKAFLCETAATAIFVLAVFGVAVKMQHSRFVRPFALLFSSAYIATAFGAMVSAIGLFTGGALNPARQFGPELLTWSWKGYSWVYYFGPFIGGILGGLLYEFVASPIRRSVDYKYPQEYPAKGLAIEVSMAEGSAYLGKKSAEPRLRSEQRPLLSTA